MFNDAGKKIKISAIIAFIVLLIGSLGGAIAVWIQDWMVARGIIGFGVLIGGAAVSFFIALMIHGFGIIVSSHEEKTIHTRSVEYNGSLFANLNNSPKTSEWKCPKCGKINQNYVGTCGCGEVKPK